MAGKTSCALGAQQMAEAGQKLGAASHARFECASHARAEEPPELDRDVMSDAAGPRCRTVLAIRVARWRVRRVPVGHDAA
ncbi:MAG: hypothetical protein NW205_10990 [Hyphomicrobiaceae bacterium]|nr:hypothetical protein [Hyphomicrobiaceae bacterium]